GVFVSRTSRTVVGEVWCPPGDRTACTSRPGSCSPHVFASGSWTLRIRHKGPDGPVSSLAVVVLPAASVGGRPLRTYRSQHVVARGRRHVDLGNGASSWPFCPHPRGEGPVAANVLDCPLHPRHAPRRCYPGTRRS